MRRNFALTIAVIGGILAAPAILYIHMLSNVWYHGRPVYLLAFLANRMIFFATIWVSEPLGKYVLERFGPSAHLFVVFAEIALIAAVFGVLLYLLLRRTLLSSLRAIVTRRWVYVLSAVVILISVSLWSRSRLTTGEYGQSVVRDDPPPQLDISKPADGPPVVLGEVHFLQASGDTGLVARTGADPIVFTNGDFGGGSDRTGDNARIGRIAGGSIVPVGNVAVAYGGSEIRCNAETAERSLVIVEAPGLGGFRDREASAFTLAELASGSSSAGRPLPIGTAHPVAISTGSAEYAISLLQQGPAEMSTVPLYRPDIRAPGGEIAAIHKLSATGPKLVAAIPDLTAQSAGALDAVLTPDGIVHILVVQIAEGRQHQTRVRLFRFDLTKSTWLPDQVLAVDPPGPRSWLKARIVRSGSDVDVFFLTFSPNAENGGLYARRVGERTTWLLGPSNAEFSTLADADGKGSLLVGVAEDPNESSRVRFVIRRGNEWKTAGEVDLERTLYSMTTQGTETFALWRHPAEEGVVNVGFRAEGGFVLSELKLPD